MFEEKKRKEEAFCKRGGGREEGRGRKGKEGRRGFVEREERRRERRTKRKKREGRRREKGDIGGKLSVFIAQSNEGVQTGVVCNTLCSLTRTGSNLPALQYF